MLLTITALLFLAQHFGKLFPIGTEPPSGYTWYVDSVGGNNTNDGVSQATPIKDTATLATEPNYKISDTVWVKYASTWVQAPPYYGYVIGHYLAASLSGSNGAAIGTWADLSGNGNDLIQSNAALKPRLSIVNAKQYATFYNNPPNTAMQMLLPAGLTLNAQSLSVFFVSRQGEFRKFLYLRTPDTNNEWVMTSSDPLGGAPNYKPNRLGLYAGLQDAIDPNQGVFIPAGLSVLYAAGTASQTAVGNQFGEVTATTHAGSGTGGAIGMDSTNTGSSAKASITEIAIYGTGLTAGQRRNVANLYAAQYSIPANPSTFVMYEGDSLTAAYPSTDGASHPNLALESLPHTMAYNSAISGWCVANAVNDYSSRVAPYFVGLPSSVTLKVAVVFDGHNDLGPGVLCSGAGNSTGATVYGRLQTLIGYLRASGAQKIVLLTIPKGSDLTGARETERQNLNALILANAGGLADVVVDVASDSRLASPSNTTYYFSDGIHFADLWDGVSVYGGNGVIAAAVVTALQGLGAN